MRWNCGAVRCSALLYELPRLCACTPCPSTYLAVGLGAADVPSLDERVPIPECCLGFADAERKQSHARWHRGRYWAHYSLLHDFGANAHTPNGRVMSAGTTLRDASDSGVTINSQIPLLFPGTHEFFQPFTTTESTIVEVLLMPSFSEDVAVGTF